MSRLPTIQHPVFFAEFPVNGNRFSFRPFLVKEEKILLMAKESDEPKMMFNAVRQILANCILDDINVDTLCITDLEYAWIKIRAKSANNVITLSIKDERGKRHEIKVDLEQIEAVHTPDHKSLIEITKDMGIQMKYPTIDMFEAMKTDMTPVEFIAMMVKCIDFIYDGDTIFKLDQYTQEEIDEFVDSWDEATFEKIKKFFETMPKISKTVRYVDSDGKEQTLDLAGLISFF